MLHNSGQSLRKEDKSIRWENVLLTDAGFFDPFDMQQPLSAIINRFAHMVKKPFCEARVLFIPTAACDDEARKIASILKSELLWLGFLPDNIVTYQLDGSMTEDMALTYDIMYFTCGWDGHLLKTIKQTKFERIIMSFIFANKVYVGMSAGSVIATPNIMGCFDDPNNPETEALGLINAYIDCHCNLKPDLKPKALPLPHIMLYTHQALAVNNLGFELIEEDSACHHIDWSNPPVMGVDVFNEDRHYNR